MNCFHWKVHTNWCNEYLHQIKRILNALCACAPAWVLFRARISTMSHDVMAAINNGLYYRNNVQKCTAPNSQFELCSICLHCKLIESLLCFDLIMSICSGRYFANVCKMVLVSFLSLFPCVSSPRVLSSHCFRLETLKSMAVQFTSSVNFAPNHTSN